MNYPKLRPQYYVYYEHKTGRIIAITNEKSDSYETGIEVSFDDVEKLLNGEQDVGDYKVGYRDSSDKSTLEILTKDYFYLDYNFKNRSFEWIDEIDVADCIVEWNKLTKSWVFFLDKDFKKTYNNNILETQLTFFVTLATDFDFLIRTIGIRMEDLINLDKVEIPFSSNIESNIDKISIGTKIVFKTYGLRKIDNE